MDISNNINNVLSLLKTHPKLVIGISKIEYLHLKLFIEGFFSGINQVLELDLLWSISRWYQKKISQESSLYITSQIQHLHPNKGDEELKSDLLENLQIYFLENPKWYMKKD